MISANPLRSSTLTVPKSLIRPPRSTIWETHPPLEVARPKPAYVIRRTAPEVSERIGQRARTHLDIEMATRLNDAGYRSGQGGAFTASMVQWLR
jgi:hypothetical protein